MSTDLAIRVTLPWSDCSGIVQRWCDRASKAVVYQHDEDDEVSRTHVHMALVGLDCKTEALKRMWADAPGKGNEFWSFSPLRDQGKYTAYMTKGILRPVFVKNFSPAELEEHKKSWVDPIRSAGRQDPLEYLIKKIYDRLVTDTYHEFCENHWTVPCQDTYHSGDSCTCNGFDVVRKVTFKVLWGENRRVPHATQYKIVASTVFLRLCEKWLMLDRGLEAVRNLWY